MSERTTNIDWGKKGSIYEEVILEKCGISKITDISNITNSQNNTERMSLTAKRFHDLKKSGCAIANENLHSEIFKQTVSKISLETKKQFDEEFQQFLNKFDKKKMLPPTRQTY